MCNVPKKGHICPFERVYKKSSDHSAESKMLGNKKKSNLWKKIIDNRLKICLNFKSDHNCVAVQNELGGIENTIRVLDLQKQGTFESYIKVLYSDNASIEFDKMLYEIKSWYRLLKFLTLFEFLLAYLFIHECRCRYKRL